MWNSRRRPWEGTTHAYTRAAATPPSEKPEIGKPAARLHSGILTAVRAADATAAEAATHRRFDDIRDRLPHQ